MASGSSVRKLFVSTTRPMPSARLKLTIVRAPGGEGSVVIDVLGAVGLHRDVPAHAVVAVVQRSGAQALARGEMGVADVAFIQRLGRHDLAPLSPCLG